MQIIPTLAQFEVFDKNKCFHRHGTTWVPSRPETAFIVYLWSHRFIGSLKGFMAHRSKIEMFVGIPTYLKYDVFAMNYFVYFKADFYPCLVCCERLLQCPDSLCKQNCGIILLKQPWVIDQNLMTCFWHVCSGRSMLRSWLGPPLTG